MLTNTRPPLLLGMVSAISSPTLYFSLFDVKEHGSGALVVVAFPALPVRCIDIECRSGDVSALRVFDQDEVTAPFVFGSTEGPAAAAVAEFYLFGLKQFVVLVLCEVAEVVAVVVPPPAPLDAVELHFHFSAAAEQVSFTVYIHDLHGMVLTRQQEIEGCCPSGSFIPT